MSDAFTIIFAVSDKGGTGRSVTACNVAYRLAQQGHDVAYLDFDFGSPTAGAIFEIDSVERGIDHGGLHSYFLGTAPTPARVDIRKRTQRKSLRIAAPSVGELVLFPGDQGGAEFASEAAHYRAKCVELFLQLKREFEVVVVDLSAGRSLAAHLVLQATRDEQVRDVRARWLVFHRWTRQHIIAAHSLVRGPFGLLRTGESAGHDRDALEEAIRYVRTAVPTLDKPHSAERPAQAEYLREANAELKQLAMRYELGHSVTYGETPMEPMLQWREQIITDTDVANEIANEATVDAFQRLALRLVPAGTQEGR
jgi:CobQ/CobB/MinD/ParA nucleotide binding domain